MQAHTITQQIKDALSMQTVVEHYGFEVSRSGFIKCPFHQGDHTASLKIYPGSCGFHCFGCGAHGSVIDFVMRLFNLNFQQAALRINADFHLGLTSKRPTRAEQSRILEERRAERRGEERAEENFRRVVAEMWYWKEAAETFQPVRTSDTAYYHPLYVEAVNRLPYIEYWLDEFIEKGGKKEWRKFQTLPLTIT